MPLEHLPIEKVTPFFGAHDGNDAVSDGSAAPDAAMETLISSIRARGVLKPILVRPLGANDKTGDDSGEERYAIMPGMGARRFQASQIAGLTRIPAFVVFPGDDDDETPDEAVETDLAAVLSDGVAPADADVQNAVADEASVLQAAAPAPLSLAWARDARRLLQTGSYEEACATLGVSENDFHDALELLTLPPTVLQLLEMDADNAATSAFTTEHARILLRELHGDPDLQSRLARKTQTSDLTLAAFTDLALNVAAAAFDNDKIALADMLDDEQAVIPTAPVIAAAAPLPRTAQGWAARIADDSTALGLLLDERIADYLAPDEITALVAVSSDAVRRMELFVHKLRRAGEARTGTGINDLDSPAPSALPAARLACPLCGHAEREAATRCTVCWTPLRRCADCAHYDPSRGVCNQSGDAIAPADADNPQKASASACCGKYVPAFTPRAFAESFVVVE